MLIRHRVKLWIEKAMMKLGMTPASMEELEGVNSEIEKCEKCTEEQVCEEHVTAFVNSIDPRDEEKLVECECGIKHGWKAECPRCTEGDEC